MRKSSLKMNKNTMEKKPVEIQHAHPSQCPCKQIHEDGCNWGMCWATRMPYASRSIWKVLKMKVKHVEIKTDTFFTSIYQPTKASHDCQINDWTSHSIIGNYLSRSWSNSHFISLITSCNSLEQFSLPWTTKLPLIFSPHSITLTLSHFYICDEILQFTFEL